MNMKIIKILKLLSVLYVAIIFLSLMISTAMQFPSFEEVGHLKHGCYWRDALVPYIECRGLPLNEAVKSFLNLWILLLYSGMFSLVSLRSLVSLLLLCSPILYLLWYWRKGRHLTKPSI
jgi:hypothetical protein